MGKEASPFLSGHKAPIWIFHGKALVLSIKPDALPASHDPWNKICCEECDMPSLLCKEGSMSRQFVLEEEGMALAIVHPGENALGLDV